MPIYTYQCDKCGYTFDDLGPMGGPNELPCVRPLPDAKFCDGVARKIPAAPAPAQFNCSMPTYQKPKSS